MASTFATMIADARAHRTRAALVIGALLALASAQAAASTPNKLPPARGVDYFVLLDVSGSMQANDPSRVTVLSTLLLGALLGPDDRVLVAKHADASVVIPLGKTPDLKALRPIAAYSEGTDCRAGFRVMKPAMDAAHAKSPKRPQVVVVLGDGDCAAGSDYATELQALSAGRSSPIPSVFIALGAGSQQSFQQVQSAVSAGTIVSFSVALGTSDPLAQGAASSETLLSAFAGALRVGAAYSEAVEATPEVPTLQGCMTSAETRLLVLADRAFTVTVHGVDAKGAPDTAGSVTAKETLKSTYQYSKSSKEYHYAIHHVTSTAAQLRVEVSPPEAVWRALFVPVQQSDARDRSLLLGVGGCPPAALWPADPAKPEPIATGAELCFRTHLTGRCDERNARVVVTDARTGLPETTLALGRIGTSGVFDAPSAPWRCKRGDWSARVVADHPTRQGQTVDLSPARDFSCAACKLKEPLDLKAAFSWCCEESARVVRVTAPLEEACPDKSVVVPLPDGPHAACFAIAQDGLPRQDPGGAWVVDLAVTFNPEADGCALDPAMSTVDLPIPAPGGPPGSTLHLTFTNPFDKLTAIGARAEAQPWDACPAGGNVAHLSLVNGAACPICLVGSRVDVKTDGDAEQVTLVAEASPGDALVELAPPILTIPAGATISLATLRTDSSLCSLDGVHEAVVTVFPTRRFAVPVGSQRFDFHKPLLSDGWWICRGAAVVATLLFLLLGAAALLLIVNTYGFPGELRDISVIATVDEKGKTRPVPLEGDYAPGARARNWMLTRWFTGSVRYGLYVKPASKHYRGDITFHFKDGFRTKRRLPIQSIRSVPEGLVAASGSDVHPMRAELRLGAKKRSARETFADLIGPLLHPIRWPLWLFILGCLALLIYSWSRLAGLCS